MSQSDQEKPTCVSYFRNSEQNLRRNREYICLGSPRCGTSMVAGAMACLGINMGQELKENIENPVFNLDGHRERYAEFIDRAKLAIKKYQSSQRVWGWKYPQAVEYLPDLREHLIQPSLIIVYRDPVPALLRATRHSNDESKRNAIVEREMKKTLFLFQRNFDLARQWKVPTLLVSYERASLYPREFLRELSDFCRVPLPKNVEPIVQFMRPGSYKTLPHL